MVAARLIGVEHTQQQKREQKDREKKFLKKSRKCEKNA
jgi:hypothetical protein